MAKILSGSISFKSITRYYPKNSISVPLKSKNSTVTLNYVTDIESSTT